MIANRPESVGFSARKLCRLSPLLQAYVTTGKVPGLVAIIARRGQIAFAEACGVMDTTTGKPMPLDGIFRLASQSKLITAVAALRLYENGAFDVYDPVASYLPQPTTFWPHIPPLDLRRIVYPAIED